MAVRDTSRRRRRTAGLAAVLAAGLLACPWNSQAEPTFPGLPEPAFQPGGHVPVSQIGVAETAKARQWVITPELTVTTYVGTLNTINNPEPGVAYRQAVVGDAFFVSPPGAPEPYGYLPPMRVRTVGFGLLPVEAVVEVSQRRANGVPIPLHAELSEDTLTSPPGQEGNTKVYVDTHIRDSLNVRIVQVLVDGIDVGLTAGCRTARPAPVDLISPGYTFPWWAQINPKAYYESIDPATYFNPMYGGQLTGTLEIPPFTGCTTKKGDDLSAMMTLSVSGPGNRAIFRAAACGRGDVDEQGRIPPVPTGHYTPALSGCEGPDPIPYPQRDDD